MSDAARDELLFLPLAHVFGDAAVRELLERARHLRGPWSTMPQKANPIDSETLIGMSILASSLVPPLLAAMQGGHERSAGEWQAEWDAVPSAFALASGALAGACRIVGGQVFADRMRTNLGVAGGLVMAEAVMMATAPLVGRARAHELVYEACTLVRERGGNVAAALREIAGDDVAAQLDLGAVVDPTSYLGEADATVAAAVEDWARGAELVTP